MFVACLFLSPLHFQTTLGFLGLTFTNRTHLAPCLIEKLWRQSGIQIIWPQTQKQTRREGSVIVREDCGGNLEWVSIQNEGEEIEGKFVTTKCGAMAAAKRDRQGSTRVLML